MKAIIQNIPNEIIYEMVAGTPIYYKGYKDYLSGKKQLAEIRASSTIQGFLASEINFLLRSYLGREYMIFSNEIGLQFSKKSWRAADIAIIESKKIQQLNNKYLNVAPEVVIEIDTKADLNALKNPLGYYQEKTDQLLKFGVNKVIWIFTETEKVLVANEKDKWEMTNWNQDIHVINNLTINVAKIVKNIQH